MSLITPTRILIVGGGGREHALAWKLSAEPGVNEVIVSPGSDAIADEPRVRRVAGVDPLDPATIVAVARREAVELVVIGPEGPLAVGVTDALIEAGFAVFGPTAAAARIEASKAYCHEIAAAAGVRMAKAAAFTDAAAAVAYATGLAAAGAGVVVKADGLAAGKGVTVCDTAVAAERAIASLAAYHAADLAANAADHAATAAYLAANAADHAADRPWIVIEERLRGPEASLIALCDGRDAVALPLARDHKRLRDGDEGPITGGMGAYSPLPDLADDAATALLTTIHRPILAELARRGTPFRGALYAGLMLTADGPVLLECNARFGDPETQAILPRLAVALGPLLLAAARGDLRGALTSQQLRDGYLPTLPGATVALVLAAAGYPEQPQSGDAIEGLDAAVATGALVFHAGTRRDADGTVRTAGGRVLSVVGRGSDLENARLAAVAAADRIRAAGLQRRGDIGLACAPAPAMVR